MCHIWLLFTRSTQPSCSCQYFSPMTRFSLQVQLKKDKKRGIQEERQNFWSITRTLNVNVTTGKDQGFEWRRETEEHKERKMSPVSLLLIPSWLIMSCKTILVESDFPLDKTTVILSCMSCSLFLFLSESRANTVFDGRHKRLQKQTYRGSPSLSHLLRVTKREPEWKMGSEDEEEEEKKRQ